MSDGNAKPQLALWASGDVYEPYVGRWSRLVASQFLDWLAVPARRLWLDVGSGTGALSQTILKQADPKEVKGLDRSEEFVAYAREKISDPRVTFGVADAQDLPEETASYDAAVTGLVLNFVPQPERALSEMTRVVRPGGVVAVYVWDYAGKMQFMRHFWNAAVALDPAAFDLDEGRRSTICNPESLKLLFQGAGLRDVDVRSVDIHTDFKDFDDYWNPFLRGGAPAPSYAISLSEERRAALRVRIRAGLPFALDGSIPLVARTWAVRGFK